MVVLGPAGLARAVASSAPLHHVPAATWRAAAEAHRERVLKLVHGSVRVDPAHPVFNFLFKYYSFDAKLLLRYSAGSGSLLLGAPADDPVLWTGRGWRHTQRGGFVDPALVKPSTRRAAREAARVMRLSSGRSPHLNCYGLHEWAMLYAPPGAAAAPRRHQELPLRLGQAELNAVVESHPLKCTHFDAFRFFTPEAAPLNTVSPTPSRAAQPLLEQPGCVHASMDLFRYGLKLFPWVPAELLADTLELAIAARVLDMRASPYDLSAYPADAARGPGFDFSPVRIETEEGRRLYQREQAGLALRAAPLRRRMLHEYDAAIAAWGREGGTAEAAARSSPPATPTGPNEGADAAPLEVLRPAGQSG